MDKEMLRQRIELYVNSCCSFFQLNDLNYTLFYYGKAYGVYELLVVKTYGQCGTFKEVFETFKDSKYADIDYDSLAKLIF